MKCFPSIKEKLRRLSFDRRSAPAAVSASRTSVSSGSETVKSLSKSTGTISSNASCTFDEKAGNLRVFDLGELAEATKQFTPQLKIGEGGFGSVFKGFIRPADGQGSRIKVAIKRLNQNSVQGHKQWLAEVRFLAVVDHPNLVKLIGYCATDNERGTQRLLVYEFMPNKSLEHHLFRKNLPALDWDTRLRIAVEIAEGLSYLHEGLHVPVIFRDLKASNVLLDENFEAKLSDFGLAREGPSDGRSHVSTAVMGTYGYAAPEYIETGHLTTKSDLWAFGVVLFEILTGRRSLDRNRPKNEQRLLDWVKKFPPQSSRFSSVIDPRMEKSYSLAAARMVAELANSCLLKNPRDRPVMSEVVERLKAAIEPTGVEPGEAGKVTGEGISPEESKEGEGEAAKSAARRRSHLTKLAETANTANRKFFALQHRFSGS